MPKLKLEYRLTQSRPGEAPNSSTEFSIEAESEKECDQLAVVMMEGLAARKHNAWDNFTLERIIQREQLAYIGANKPENHCEGAPRHTALKGQEFPQTVTT